MATSRALRTVEGTADAEIVDLAVVRETHAPRPRYNPTTSLEKIARSELPPTAVQKLDWNEGTIAPPASVTAAMIAHIQDGDGAYLKWYPNLAGGDALRHELASYCSVGEENLLITNGSDDALILLCHTFLGHGKTAIAPTPTYEHFCVNAVNAGANLVRLDLSNPFLIDVDLIAGGIARHRPALVYLVSPNNPTGISWPVETVRELAESFPDDMFVVDEAYHEFGAIDPLTGLPVTCAELAATSRNVVVTRTFSKAFCLASVRCGYVIAHPATLEDMRAHYNPKSVNQLAQVAAVAALREFETHYRPYIEATNAAREAFIADLVSRGIEARSGGAGNFVCVHVPDGRTAELCRRLEDHAIYVRDLGARFPGYVRITVGLEMDRVAGAIDHAMRDMNHRPRS
jgi:histidinol-phosphate aminotransferase